MVVRDTTTLAMADSLIRSAPDPRSPAAAASVEQLTVDVVDSAAGTARRLSGEDATYEVKQGGTRLSSQNLAALTTGLKIMTSLRGHFNVTAKMKCGVGGGSVDAGPVSSSHGGLSSSSRPSVDGAGVVISSLSRRSEDDDGYCSRSSLDSPVQITRPDAAVSPTTTEDSPVGDTFPAAADDDSTLLGQKVPEGCHMPEGCHNTGRGSCPASPLPGAGGGPGQCEDDENIGGCGGGSNGELKVLDCSTSSQTVAAVASLDHCYLTAAIPPSTTTSANDDQVPSPADAGDAPTRLEDSDDVGSSAVDDETTAGKQCCYTVEIVTAMSVLLK